MTPLNRARWLYRLAIWLTWILATLAVYLDVYNIFVGLLNLVMAFGGGDRD